MKRFLSLAVLGAAFMAMAAWAQAPLGKETPASLPERANADSRAAGREAVRKEREAIAQTLRQSEAACYQRFAVEDCLRKARRHARDAQAVLRQRESVWDEAERQERAAQRLEDIQQRQNTRTAPVPAQPAVTTNRVDTNADGDAQAGQRARHQVQRQQAARQAQVQRGQAARQQAERERLRSAERMQTASDRKARVQKRQAEDAAKGMKPAAPLPP